MKNRMVSGKRRCLCIVKKDRSGNCSENPKQKSIFFLAFGCFGVLGFSDVMLNNQHTMDCEQIRECFCWGYSKEPRNENGENKTKQNTS